MTITRNRTIAAGAAALAVAIGGTGVAYATGTIGSQTPEQRQAAILQDLAGKLGVSVDKLRTAIKAVAGDQIDQALADGKLTQAQADQLKQQLESSTLLPFGIGGGRGFGGPGFGHHGGPGFGFGAGLDEAAAYLGLTEAELRTQLQSGKTLAQVAQAQGKSVDGLKQALVAAATKKLDAAVAAGKLTADQRSQILSQLQSRIDDMVNGTMPGPGLHGPGMHFGRSGGQGPQQGQQQGAAFRGGWG